MRYIVIDKESRLVKSVADLPFSYEYSVQVGDELVVGYEEYVFNLMSNDYFFSDGDFTEVSRA